MDPYLEHPALCPDVHNSLLAALRDPFAPLVAPRYYVSPERRTYFWSADDRASSYGVADVCPCFWRGRQDTRRGRRFRAGNRGGRLEVDVPSMEEEVERSSFLEVRDVQTATVVTIIVGAALAGRQTADGAATRWLPRQECAALYSA